MVHISKSKKTGQFIVTVVANNGEKLNSSELLKTKQSAWKNIRSQMRQFGCSTINVQDNALPKPCIVHLHIIYGTTKQPSMKCLEAPKVK